MPTVILLKKKAQACPSTAIRSIYVLTSERMRSVISATVLTAQSFHRSANHSLRGKGSGSAPKSASLLPEQARLAKLVTQISIGSEFSDLLNYGKAIVPV